MNPKLKYILLAQVTAFSALPYTANATPMLSSEGDVAFYNATSNAQDGSTACFAFSAVGATVACSSTVSGTASPPTTGSTGAALNYSTTATAGYGVLKAGGQSSITGANGTSNTTDYSSSFGQAYFQDSWTITGGTGTGTLELQFALDGTYSFCTPHEGLVTGFSLVNLDNFSFSSANLLSPACAATVSKNVLLTTGFTFGTPVDFRVAMTAGSNLYDLGNDLSSSIDFSDTAQMNAIIVEDANGDVIPFGLTTGSGAALFSQLAPGTPPTSVPEPAPLALFGIGLIGLAAARRRRPNQRLSSAAPSANTDEVR